MTPPLAGVLPSIFFFFATNHFVNAEKYSDIRIRKTKLPETTKPKRPASVFVEVNQERTFQILDFSSDHRGRLFPLPVPQSSRVYAEQTLR
jgi:hypothetical protein